MKTKHIYIADHGQYVLQIRDMQGSWQDYLTLKSQSELDAGLIRVRMCGGCTDRPGVFRVIHQFMGTTVLKA